MRSEQITVGDMTFIMSEASAQDQLELMTILSARSSYTVAASGVTQVDANLVVGILTRLSLDELERVAKLVIGNVRKKGEQDLPVDVKTFQGKIMSYYLLIAEAVKFNLDDFFTYVLNDAMTARENGQSQTTTA